MKRETYEAVMDALDELQGEAMDKHKEHASTDSDKSMYFLGKDIALAEAKDVVRKALNDDLEPPEGI